MQIRECRRTDISDVSVFYDRVVAWMDQNNQNYPKWKYKIYPSVDYVRAMTEAGEQYLCIEDDRIIGAFVLNTDPQGNYQKGAWKQNLPDGTYMVLHTLAIAPEVQGTGLV